MEILGGVLDNTIAIGSANFILLDTLAVLASKDIKMKLLSAIHKKEEEEGDFDEENETEKLVSEATGRMLSKIQRKNVIENIIPIVIELKSKFEQMRSPLLRFLMGYLKELVSDYKDEINDILAIDL
jgi:condensin-2 complex subunit D3